MTVPGIPLGRIATFELSRAAVYQLLYNNSKVVSNPRNSVAPIDLTEAEEVIRQRDAIIPANARRPVHSYERVIVKTASGQHIIMLYVDLSLVGRGEPGYFDPRTYEFHNPDVQVDELIKAQLVAPDAATMSALSAPALGHATLLS